MFTSTIKAALGETLIKGLRSGVHGGSLPWNERGKRRGAETGGGGYTNRQGEGQEEREEEGGSRREPGKEKAKARGEEKREADRERERGT